MPDIDPRIDPSRTVRPADFSREFFSRSDITHLLVLNEGQLGKISVEDFLRDIYQEPDSSPRYMALKAQNPDPSQETKFVEDDFLGTNGVMFTGNRLAQAFPTPPADVSSSVLGIAVKTQVSIPFYAASDSVEPENNVISLVKQGVLTISDERFDVYKARNSTTHLLYENFYAFFRRDAILPDSS